MRLALQLLTYNKPEILLPLFDSLAAQTDRDWMLFVLDNSTDPHKARQIEAYVSEQKDRLPIVFERSQNNSGFDGGHESLYHRHEADFVMLVNDDAILDPEYIQRLMDHLATHPRVAAVSGTILRWDFDVDADGADGVRSGIGNLINKTNIIDSLGLAKTRYHKVYDIGAGKKIPDSRPDPIPVDPIPVFGVSGCLPIYRREAVGAQLFDPSYFMYKEDVEISYRFAETGWQVMVVPAALAYHRRTFKEEASRRNIPFRIQWWSYRNHLRNLRKHLTWKDWLSDGWAVIPYETAKAVYMVFAYVRHCAHHRHL